MSLEMSLYFLIKPIINRLGFDVVRYRPIKIDNPFNVLEFIIYYYLSLNTPFNFIQIGANDGIRWDPLHDLILKHHLVGLLVEPLPDMFEKLKRNYESEPQLSFENVAISTENGTRKIYRAKPDANVPDYVHGMAGFNKDKFVDEFKEYDQFVQELQVPTMTIKALLEKHKIHHVTLLQIDTEGYDYEIIKMFFQNGVLPEIINYEYVYFSYHENLECRKSLINNGYRFIDVDEGDTLAIRGGSPAHL
ncbi:MAG: FkbM family methyltransferase [Methanothrix sp.]